MARTADEQRRVELLERIVDYVMENGLSDLSLRPLAEAVATSPRVLLYYFDSKEELIASVMAGARERQRAIFDTLPRNPESYADTVRAAWAVMSEPKHERVFRLFFEVYGLALQDPERFPGFVAARGRRLARHISARARGATATPPPTRARSRPFCSPDTAASCSTCARRTTASASTARSSCGSPRSTRIPSPKELADDKRR